MRKKTPWCPNWNHPCAQIRLMPANRAAQRVQSDCGPLWLTVPRSRGYGRRPTDCAAEAILRRNPHHSAAGSDTTASAPSHRSRAPPAVSSSSRVSASPRRPVYSDTRGIADMPKARTAASARSRREGIWTDNGAAVFDAGGPCAAPTPSGAERPTCNLRIAGRHRRRRRSTRARTQQSTPQVAQIDLLKVKAARHTTDSRIAPPPREIAMQ